MSHSWQTHNYSISSTINGNSLKLHGEIKQTPSPRSSNSSASTLSPITPSIPSPPGPYTLSSLSNTLFNHLFILPSLCCAHIYICSTCPLRCPPSESMYGPFPKQHRALVGTYVWVCIKEIGSGEGGSVDPQTLMGYRVKTYLCLKDMCVVVQWSLYLRRQFTSQELCWYSLTIIVRNTDRHKVNCG